MHILELSALVHAAGEACETDGEIYQTVIDYLLQRDCRLVSSPPVDEEQPRRLAGEIVRGLRRLARTEVAPAPTPNYGGCGSCPHPSHVVPCYCGCRSVSVIYPLQQDVPPKTTCLQCGTLYRQGERHACAPRVTQMLDPATRQECSTVVEGPHPQPGEKVDVDKLVARVRELEALKTADWTLAFAAAVKMDPRLQAPIMPSGVAGCVDGLVRTVRLEVLQQVMRALERCTLLGNVDGVALRRELRAMAALAGGSLEERT